MVMAQGKTGEAYRYCSVCRQNHDHGRKHIFTSQHKNCLAVILTKLSKRVHQARRQLQRPTVRDGEVEPGAAIWCYPCEEEVGRHVSDGQLTVEWGGVLEHLASSDHHKRTRHFWWEHGVDKTRLQAFLLFPAELQRYKKLVTDALRDLEEARSERVKKVAQELQSRERHQQMVAMEPPVVAAMPPPVYRTVRNQNGVMQNPTGWHEGQRVWGGGIVRYRQDSDQLLAWPVDAIGHCGSASPATNTATSVTKVTVAAYSDNLTFIDPQPSRGSVGNVHSGATPPWLQDDTSHDLATEGKTALIGPSLEDFIKHKELKDLAGKNPRRVGADFRLQQTLARHRGEVVEEGDWLPSFGGVWNAGPRSRTLMEFRHKLAAHKSGGQTATPPTITHKGPGDQTRGHSPSTSGPSAGSYMMPGDQTPTTSGLPQIRPYVRKRTKATSCN